jgi:tetratricopeptide (TPR) repeat protein
MVGSWAKGTEHAREAEALAEALGDGRRQGRALGRLAISKWNAGDPEGALELAQRALDLATAHGDLPSQALASQRLGFVWMTIGEYRRAAERLRQVVETLEGDRRYERLEPPSEHSSSRWTASPGVSRSWASSPRRWRAPTRQAGLPASSMIPVP